MGELRDLETMSIAVTAAEMGILVMGTLHTNGAAQTVDRMVNVFPSDKQSHVRTMLSTSLRGVVSQQLLQRADKQGRVAALEILVNTPAAANLIRQGKLDQLENTMQAGGQFGMRTMDTAIQQLLDQRQITGKEAYKKAINKAKFEDCQGLRLTGARRPRGGPPSTLCRLAAMAAQDSSSPPRFPTPTARSTSATSWSTSRRTSGCASSACRATQVHFVGADDAHGAPIMLKAESRGHHAAAAGGAHRGGPAALPAGLPPQLRSLALDRLAGEHRAVAGHLPAPEGGRADLRASRSSSSTTR